MAPIPLFPAAFAAMAVFAVLAAAAALVAPAPIAAAEPAAIALVNPPAMALIPLCIKALPPINIPTVINTLTKPLKGPVKSARLFNMLNNPVSASTPPLIILLSKIPIKNS